MHFEKDFAYRLFENASLGKIKIRPSDSVTQPHKTEMFKILKI
jgi:hypothetical protein